MGREDPIEFYINIDGRYLLKIDWLISGYIWLGGFLNLFNFKFIININLWLV